MYYKLDSLLMRVVKVRKREREREKKVKKERKKERLLSPKQTCSESDRSQGRIRSSKRLFSSPMISVTRLGEILPI